MLQPVITEHIEITPGICGGRARIAGHRIRVQDIVVWSDTVPGALHDRLRLSPDEIVSQYPSITLADVYAALAYYHDHLQEIRSQIQADDDLVAQMQAETLSLVQQKLTERNAYNYSLPPG